MKTIFLCLISGAMLFAQELPFEGFISAPSPDKGLRLCFYNVENLFDNQDDSLTRDEEFLPDGEKNWTVSRYWDKQKNIAKTVLALGYEEAPALIGLCEIENRQVLEDLAGQDLMRVHDYRVVHFDSPDRRGIDVGLLVKRDAFEVLSASFIRLNKEDDPEWKSRDILYAKLAMSNWVDTLHVFVNHWPSRRGGEEASRPLRIMAAKALKETIDSIGGVSPKDVIVIMGDLNDGVGDASLVEGLQVENGESSEMKNLVDGMSELDPELGTHKYRGHWAYLDHFVLSKNLLTEEGRSYTDGVKVFRATWLLQADDRYTGDYPKRTYAGPRYLGGYSDHLPIYIDIFPRE